MIIELTGDEALAYAPEIKQLYAAGFGYPAGVVEQFGATYSRCVQDYAGARVLLACHDGEPVGFAYGYTFQRGHWWPEQVGPSLEHHGHATWLQDAFELAELVVDPSHQNQGTGTALLTHVLQTTGHRRVLLATGPDNPARRLYRRTGFTELLPDFRYGATGPAAVIMGLDRDDSGRHRPAPGATRSR